MIAGLRHVGRLRHKPVVHLDRYGFSGSDFYSPVVRQDVFFSVLAGHFGYGVFADPKFNVDFAVLIRPEFLRIGIAHEVGAGNFESAALDVAVVGGLYHFQGAGLRPVEESNAGFGFNPHDKAVFNNGEGVVRVVFFEEFRAFFFVQKIVSARKILQLERPGSVSDISPTSRSMSASNFPLLSTSA